MHRWTSTRAWLVVWEAAALLLLVVALNRAYNASGLTDYEVGVTPMAFELLIGSVQAAVAALACAVVGLLPAAWRALAAPSQQDVAPLSTLGSR